MIPKVVGKKREALYEKLFEAESRGQVVIGIGQASAKEIDALNILQATFFGNAASCRSAERTTGSGNYRR